MFFKRIKKTVSLVLITAMFFNQAIPAEASSATPGKGVIDIVQDSGGDSFNQIKDKLGVNWKDLGIQMLVGAVTSVATCFIPGGGNVAGNIVSKTAMEGVLKAIVKAIIAAIVNALKQALMSAMSSFMTTLLQTGDIDKATDAMGSSFKSGLLMGAISGFLGSIAGDLMSSVKLDSGLDKAFDGLGEKGTKIATQVTKSLITTATTTVGAMALQSLVYICTTDKSERTKEGWGSVLGAGALQGAIIGVGASFASLGEQKRAANESAAQSESQQTHNNGLNPGSSGGSGEEGSGGRGSPHGAGRGAAMARARVAAGAGRQSHMPETPEPRTGFGRALKAYVNFVEPASDGNGVPTGLKGWAVGLIKANTATAIKGAYTKENSRIEGQRRSMQRKLNRDNISQDEFDDYMLGEGNYAGKDGDGNSKGYFDQRDDMDKSKNVVSTTVVTAVGAASSAFLDGVASTGKDYGNQVPTRSVTGLATRTAVSAVGSSGGDIVKGLVIGASTGAVDGAFTNIANNQIDGAKEIYKLSRQMQDGDISQSEFEDKKADVVEEQMRNQAFMGAMGNLGSTLGATGGQFLVDVGAGLSTLNKKNGQSITESTELTMVANSRGHVTEIETDDGQRLGNLSLNPYWESEDGSSRTVNDAEGMGSDAAGTAAGYVLTADVLDEKGESTGETVSFDVSKEEVTNMFANPGRHANKWEDSTQQIAFANGLNNGTLSVLEDGQKWDDAGSHSTVLRATSGSLDRLTITGTSNATRSGIQLPNGGADISGSSVRLNPSTGQYNVYDNQNKAVMTTDDKGRSIPMTVSAADLQNQGYIVQGEAGMIDMSGPVNSGTVRRYTLPDNATAGKVMSSVGNVVKDAAVNAGRSIYSVNTIASQAGNWASTGVRMATVGELSYNSETGQYDSSMDNLRPVMDNLATQTGNLATTTTRVLGNYAVLSATEGADPAASANALPYVSMQEREQFRDTMEQNLRRAATRNLVKAAEAGNIDEVRSALTAMGVSEEGQANMVESLTVSFDDAFADGAGLSNLDLSEEDKRILTDNYNFDFNDPELSASQTQILAGAVGQIEEIEALGLSQDALVAIYNGDSNADVDEATQTMVRETMDNEAVKLVVSNAFATTTTKDALNRQYAGLGSANIDAIVSASSLNDLVGTNADDVETSNPAMGVSAEPESLNAESIRDAFVVRFGEDNADMAMEAFRLAHGTNAIGEGGSQPGMLDSYTAAVMNKYVGDDRSFQRKVVDMTETGIRLRNASTIVDDAMARISANDGSDNINERYKQMGVSGFGDFVAPQIGRAFLDATRNVAVDSVFGTGGTPGYLQGMDFSNFTYNKNNKQDYVWGSLISQSFVGPITEDMIQAREHSGEEMVAAGAGIISHHAQEAVFTRADGVPATDIGYVSSMIAMPALFGALASAPEAEGVLDSGEVDKINEGFGIETDGNTSGNFMQRGLAAVAGAHIDGIRNMRTNNSSTPGELSVTDYGKAINGLGNDVMVMHQIVSPENLRQIRENPNHINPRTAEQIQYANAFNDGARNIMATTNIGAKALGVREMSMQFSSGEKYRIDDIIQELAPGAFDQLESQLGTDKFNGILETLQIEDIATITLADLEALDANTTKEQGAKADLMSALDGYSLIHEYIPAETAVALNDRFGRDIVTAEGSDVVGRDGGSYVRFSTEDKARLSDLVTSDRDLGRDMYKLAGVEVVDGVSAVARETVGIVHTNPYSYGVEEGGIIRDVAFGQNTIATTSHDTRLEVRQDHFLSLAGKNDLDDRLLNRLQIRPVLGTNSEGNAVLEYQYNGQIYESRESAKEAYLEYEADMLHEIAPVNEYYKNNAMDRDTVLTSDSPFS